jgi:hypothetical protein
VNNQSLITCLNQIKTNVEQGNAKAALLNIDKLNACLAQCECYQVRAKDDFPELIDDLPHYLIQQGG